MITYKGVMNSELMNALMNSLEPRLRCIETNLKVRKKLFNIFIECLQNILHHQEFDTPYNCSDHVTMLLLTTNSDGYCLETGNMIANEKIASLKGWLDLINTFSYNELRIVYRNILSNGQFSDKGTAGLGFLEIARKSGQKLSYEFQPLNSNYSIFSFNITIPYFSLN